MEVNGAFFYSFFLCLLAWVSLTLALALTDVAEGKALPQPGSHTGDIGVFGQVCSAALGMAMTAARGSILPPQEGGGEGAAGEEGSRRKPLR